MTSGKFTVDTHLFRELGELLVGRDSTALVELIKNSYDADATVVTVTGQNLSDSATGSITVVDDGNGMTPSEFEAGFLRIASRSKEGGDRRSRRFKRRFTGQKGVGRLAAHKLASELTVESRPFTSTRTLPGVSAYLNWKEIEKFDSLDDVDESALLVERLPSSRSNAHGTEIVLSSLRRAWSEKQRSSFVREVAGFAPPDLLTCAETRDLPFPLFKSGISIRDVVSKIGGSFAVHLEGDFAAGDEYAHLTPTSASWIVEVDARGHEIVVAIVPTPLEVSVTPAAEQRRFSVPRSEEHEPIRFVARVLVHEGSRQGVAKFGPEWPSHLTGIRVYMEGFRVLPYGETSDDWLELDAMYKRRAPNLTRIRYGTDFGPSLEREAQSTLGNGSYIGAVFLTEIGSPGLDMLVNREGFVPSAAFESLAETMGVCIDLATRTRAAASLHRREQRRTGRQLNAKSKTGGSSPEELTARVERMSSLVTDARVHLSQGDVAQAVEDVSRASEIVTEISAITIDLASEQAMLRVLASLGTQMSAFIHEVNGLLALAEQIEPMLASELKGRPGVSKIRSTMIELRRGLERQSSYLLDVVTQDARRRRSSQNASAQFDSASSLVALSAARNGIEIRNEIPPNLKTPPMFRAELTTILGNLLTNAIKNAGESGNVRAHGHLDEDSNLHLTVENTGVAVELANSERWFDPFESTTTAVDASLGQGMGLGLTITRTMLLDYGGRIEFVQPSINYATAIEIVLPKGRRG